MIKHVSAGELKRGMYVVVYQTNDPIMIAQENIRQATPIPVEGEEWTQEEIEIKEIVPKLKTITNYFPWFKGIPWKILDIAGPIVAVKTFGVQNTAPVMFFDSRFNQFMEVKKSFYKSYWGVMGINFDKKDKIIQPPPKKSELVKTTLK